MKAPKILFVGGPDVNARIPLMQRLDDFHITALGSLNDLKDEFTKAGFEYFSYPLHRGTNPFADFSTLLYLTRLFRLLRPHIVHTFDTKPGVWGRLAARLAGVPIVIGTLPGLGTLYTNHSFSTRLKRSIYQPLQKLACLQSDLTTFQHKTDARQFVDSGIVPKHKTVVIPGSGVETKVYDPERIPISEREQVRTELGIPLDALVVTMISRLIRSKGVLEFGNSAKMVQQQHPGIKFLMVGPADTDSVDRLSSDELSIIQETVTWSGARSDIPVILAASDIFALPSYYREGIPRVLLEAASMGLPIVTTDSPGCNVIVENNVNGFLIPVRDADALAQAILKLVTDPSQRLSFGRASRHRAITHFDLSIIAQQTGDMYRKLLAEKGL